MAFNRLPDSGGWKLFGSRGTGGVLTPPAEVPDAVKDAYSQACFLIDVSPRAAGALARDCLQKMVYDFWKIAPRNKGALSEELDYIASKVPDETQSSIKHVRAFGSIEKQLSEDVNMMVETSASEAKMLVALIQTLFQDWYMERRNRRERHETLKKMGQKLANDVPLELTKEVTPQLESPSAAKKGNSAAAPAAKPVRAKRSAASKAKSASTSA